MLTLDIVDFTDNLNFQLMQLTCFKILEFKRLFPLLCSARLWGQPGEISLFVSCFRASLYDEPWLSRTYAYP